MIEILRRLILFICLLGAISTALAPAPALLSVSPIDFAQEQKDDVTFFTTHAEIIGADANSLEDIAGGDLSLQDYITKETEGRLMSVVGATWANFFNAIDEANAGKPAGDSTYNGRLNWGWLAGSAVYFKPDEAPLNMVSGALNKNKSFIYLALENEGQTRYLGVTYRLPGDAVNDAPAGLLYPYRRLSLWLLALGVIVYLLLPWRKRAPDILFYSRLTTAILPDILGLALAGMFFAIPLFVIPRSASSPDLLNFADGWGVLTVICWLFALGWTILVGLAAKYAAFQIRMLPDRMQVATLSGERDYSFADIVSVDPSARRTSRWLLAAGLAVSLFNRRALGPTLLLSTREDSGIDLVLRGGSALRIASIDYLPGIERLLEALEQHGVPLNLNGTMLNREE